MKPLDPFPIYKAGETPKRVHAVDFPAWESQGWSKEPLPPTGEPLPTPPPLGETASTLKPIAVAYGDRKAELEALYKSGGWESIRDLAATLEITTKPPGGWVEAIPLILKAEGLAE